MSAWYPDDIGPVSTEAELRKLLTAANAALAAEREARNAAIRLWNQCGERLQAFEDYVAFLSSSLGQGGLDAENIPLEEWEKRINDGIATVNRVEEQRRILAESRLEEAVALLDDAMADVSYRANTFGYAPSMMLLQKLRAFLAQSSEQKGSG